MMAHYAQAHLQPFAHVIRNLWQMSKISLPISLQLGNMPFTAFTSWLLDVFLMIAFTFLAVAFAALLEQPHGLILAMPGLRV